MIVERRDGSFKSVWFDVPGGKCFSNGIPNVNGKCVYCGHQIGDHKSDIECCDFCGGEIDQYGECPHYDECCECGIMACGFDDHDCEG